MHTGKIYSWPQKTKSIFYQKPSSIICEIYISKNIFWNFWTKKTLYPNRFELFILFIWFTDNYLGLWKFYAEKKFQLNLSHLIFCNIRARYLHTEWYTKPYPPKNIPLKTKKFHQFQKINIQYSVRILKSTLYF